MTRRFALACGSLPCKTRPRPAGFFCCGRITGTDPRRTGYVWGLSARYDPSMARALVGLGSNLGDRRAELRDAVAAVANLSQTSVVAQSALYETIPVGGPPDQPSFLNGAIVVETALEPSRLLDELLAIETALGRVRDVPWGPRTVDLDLLLYDGVVRETARLRLPHPRLAFRKFVLRGAAEIAGDWRHPLVGRTLAELASHLEQTPRYVALVGRPQGFRSQLAAEAAAAARARLVEPTPAGIPASVEQLGSHGLTAVAAIEFLRARTAAVRRSVAEAESDGAWVVDDAWPAEEAVELLRQLTGDERFLDEGRNLLTLDVKPRLIVCLEGIETLRILRRTGPYGTSLPSPVLVDIADREAALTEIAAAMDAAA
jgi:2-amino-4-hydroxy-6-hydroxymethyldihydropteridine diphosphokinase